MPSESPLDGIARLRGTKAEKPFAPYFQTRYTCRRCFQPFDYPQPPSLRLRFACQRHCAAVNTKEHIMTVSPVALRRKTECKPHPTARYWKKCDVEALFGLPFLELVYQAAEVHRQNFNPREIQLSTLLSIKTGGCPEDCAYCPQSAHHNTNLGKEQMMDVDEIVEKAKIAKSRGASRFCMGAAWRGPNPKTWRRFPQSSKPSRA